MTDSIKIPAAHSLRQETYPSGQPLLVKDWYIRITPEIARQIVAMGQPTSSKPVTPMSFDNYTINPAALLSGVTPSPSNGLLQLGRGLDPPIFFNPPPNDYANGARLGPMQCDSSNWLTSRGNTMPDITMCQSPCSRSRECYRHQDSGTKPNQTRQSFFQPEYTGEECEVFWPANWPQSRGTTTGQLVAMNLEAEEQ